VVAVDNPAVVVEAVKLAEDRSGDVVVRLYESAGGRANTTLTANFPLAGTHEVDLLERPLDTGALDGSRLRLRPFQIVTVRLARG
jgi:alpha-mannosidase